MAAKWFCKIGDREFGPLLGAQLQRLATGGQLNADSLVRREDSDVWVSATEVSELRSLLGAKTSKPQSAKAKPMARRLPVAAVAPPAAAAPPAPPPGPPIANEPGIQIDTHAAAATAHGATSAVHAAGAEKTSRTMLAGLIGLGCVVVILLVAIVFLVAGNSNSDDEQTADSEKSAAEPAGRDGQEVNTNSRDHPSAPPAPQKQANKTPPIKNWSKVSSKLVIRHKNTRLPVCNVGIRSVWVSDDPNGGPGESHSAIPVAKHDSNKKHVGDDDVLDLSALGVSGKKKRTDVTGRIIEPEPQPEQSTEASQTDAATTTKDPSTFRYVFVQLRVTNASADQPLTYLGWNGDGETKQSKDARLIVEDGDECLFVSRIESPRDDRRSESTIAPGETLDDVLVFELPDTSFERLRLVLPAEAIGQSSYLGYEIKKSDLAVALAADSGAAPIAEQDVATTKRPPSKGDLEREIQKVREDFIKPDEEQRKAEQPSAKPRGAKEEFQDLKRLIEAEKGQE